MYQYDFLSTPNLTVQETAISDATSNLKAGVRMLLVFPIIEVLIEFTYI